MSQENTIREASHAGSWYEKKAPVLTKQLQLWLDKSKEDGKTNFTGEENPLHHTRAIIAPHAGYSYCGAVAAFSYKNINPNKVRRIFVLGPSHHYHTRKCQLSQFSFYQSPTQNVPIDKDVISSLKASNQFDFMTSTTDEEEHSIEMHIPFIAHVMKGHSYGIIPILVGSLNGSSEALYGRLLAPYFLDPHSLFIISSDFCHWGNRFNYTYYDKSCGEIWESIEKLDRMGMDSIETSQPSKFSDYQAKYANTICGRHPIGVLLNILASIKQSIIHTKFIKYSQSSKCVKSSDSSVSYASAIIYSEKKSEEQDDKFLGKLTWEKLEEQQ